MHVEEIAFTTVKMCRLQAIVHQVGMECESSVPCNMYVNPAALESNQCPNVWSLYLQYVSIQPVK